MSASALLLTIEGERIVAVLQKTSAALDGTQREAVLDFSGVRRIDSGDLEALEDFARVADEKAVKLVLRGVNVHVYKVLKLVGLTQRVAFAH